MIRIAVLLLYMEHVGHHDSMLSPRQKLEKWLARACNTLKPGDQLPTDSELAATFSLCAKTVARVMRKWHAEGKVLRIKGKGTVIPSIREESVPPIGKHETSEDHLVSYLLESLGNGIFQTGQPLPQVKFLCHKFKLSPETVARAYHRLGKAGHITKVGKTFWVGRFGELMHTNPTREVCLLKYESSDFRDIFADNMLALSYRKMEHELATYGYYLRFESTSNVKSVFAAYIRQQKLPSGLILFKSNLLQYKTIFSHIREFTRRAKPIQPSAVPVLLDWDVLPDELHPIPKQVHFLPRGYISTAGARAVAKYIAAKRFKKVVFFLDERSPLENPVWHTVPRSVMLKIYNATKSLNTDIRFSFVVKPQPWYAEHATFDEFWGQAKPEIDSAVQEAGLDSAEFERNTRVTLSFTDYLNHYTDGSLWLFSHGDDAVEALGWCRTRGVNVPRAAAVFSLQNHPDCYHLGISYCNPDWEKLGHAMAHCITGFFPIDKTKSGLMRAQASVVERQSTRR